jgi:CelD/BcsL family acetyltransferase involved in cellulose biosynthesis
MTELSIGLLDADAVHDEWDRLAHRVGASPCGHPGWYVAWRAAYASRPLVVLAAHRDNVLVGVMPLLHHRRVATSPTNWHTPEYVVVAETPGVEVALLAAAVDGNGQRLQLAFVQESLVTAVESAARRAGHQVLSRVLERGPIIAVRGSFADYEAGLGGHLRAELRRRRRRLAEVGEVSFEVHLDADEGALEDFLRVEAAGWKGQQGTAIDTEPATRAFYLEVARWAAEKGWLRLALLRVDGRAVAGDIALQSNGTHYLLKTGFDPEFSRFAVGKLLRHAMVERAFDEGLGLYEFLGADDAWKKEWTQDVLPRHMVQVFAPTVRGRLDGAAHRFGRPAAKSVLAQVERWRNR